MCTESQFQRYFTTLILCQLLFAQLLFVLERHCRQTWYMRLFLSRSKALGGKDFPQRPLQIRSVLQSSHTYTLFSLATQCDIFVLLCPHFAQVGNWHSRQTLCRLPSASRPNADGGKPLKHSVHCRSAASRFSHAEHLYTSCGFLGCGVQISVLSCLHVAHAGCWHSLHTA